MYQLKKYEGKKQKKLNFKIDRSKRGRPQKHKANDKSCGGNQNSKFYKAIKTDQDLKSIMLMIAGEDKTNLALIVKTALF